MAGPAVDHDRSVYNLRSLQLEDVNNSTGNRIRTFQAIGKGGFGSIYVGTIRKAENQMFFQANKPYRLLGYYHGALLAVHPTNEHSLKALRPGSVLDDEPIKVAVKRIEMMTAHELIREASNLRVLWGHRNFVTIYGATKSKDLDCLCLVMEFVAGCNLNKFLQSRGTALFNLDWDEDGKRMCRVWESNEILWWMEKLKLFREIVNALILCHSKKLYHGDLKGANILLDRTLVPKLADFGLSFRRADISYLRSSVGGSLFWSAPEVSDDLPDPDKIYESEVVSNPYPSDVYSLGMVLAEMMLDGHVKDSFTDAELFLVDKLDGGCPVSLDHVSSQNALFAEKVLTRMKDLIDRCCEAERTERISLQECLFEVNNIYSEMCSFCSPSESSRLYENSDHVFTDAKGYKDMVLKFNEQFPNVPAWIVWSPSLNMATDAEENRLVHLFCKLDYAEGVQYVLEKGTWGFKAERDIPYIALVCVTEESVQTLKYLVVSWPDVMEKQVFLPHKACMCSNPEMFRILLNAKIDFDTWEEESSPKDPLGGWEYWMKPIHKLAASGKTAMLRMILDDCSVGSGYVNTISTGRCLLEVETPLYYAIVGGDNDETVRFLLERGGIISQSALKIYEGDLYYIGEEVLTGGLPKGQSGLKGALCGFAKEKGHFKVLEILDMLPPTFGTDRVHIEEGFSTIPPLMDDVAEPYVKRILADFETGASEEVITLHFHIEFPLQLADACCEKGYLGILQFLDQYCGLDLNLLKEKSVGGLQDNGEYYPTSGYLLHSAVNYGHADIVRFLLERGYSVDSPHFLLSATPLQCAVESHVEQEKKCEIVALLLNAGANPSYRDDGGYTAMDRVYGESSKGSRDLVRLLLEAGFDSGEKNRWGEDYMDTISQIGTRVD